MCIAEFSITQYGFVTLLVIILLGIILVNITKKYNVHCRVQNPKVLIECER